MFVVFQFLSHIRFGVIQQLSHISVLHCTGSVYVVNDMWSKNVYDCSGLSRHWPIYLCRIKSNSIIFTLTDKYIISIS